MTEKMTTTEKIIRFIYKEWDHLESYAFNSTEDEFVKKVVEAFFYRKDEKTK